MITFYYENKDLIFSISRYLVEGLILYILYKYAYSKRPSDLLLNKQTKDQLINDFHPSPLVDKILPLEMLQMPNYFQKDTKSSINYECADYDIFDLRFSNKDDLIETVREYGVGTCGPPGFYGTLDIHLELEQRIADVLGVESSILYSNNFTCINSVITCFCKQYDLIFYHEKSNEAILRAVSITKGSSIVWRNLEDLETKIRMFSDNKKRNFILCEGLFKNTGEIIDLVKLLKIKRKYKMRLILDESISIPLLHRKGCAGYFDVDIREIDVVVGSLAHVYCGNGGFSAGTFHVTDFQRLAAQSYCFSASMPGFLARNAICNFERNFSLDHVQILVKLFHDSFRDGRYLIVSSVFSPLVIITNRANLRGDAFGCNDLDDEMLFMRKVQRMLYNRGVRVGAVENPWPGIRCVIKNGFFAKDVVEIVSSITKCLQNRDNL